MKYIKLETKKDLETYMNPQRQRLLRQMHLLGEPVTPKQLSVLLDISPSSVQYHIKRLEDLGVVELDHTAQINGITARYYIPAVVTVSYGLYQGDAATYTDKEILSQNLFAQVQQGFLEACRRACSAGNEDAVLYGDAISGVAYLTPEEGKELLLYLRNMVDSHARKGPGQQAWEYGMILYNTEAPNDAKDKA